MLNLVHRGGVGVRVAPASPSAAHRRAALNEGFLLVGLLVFVGIVILCALLLFYWVTVALLPDLVGSCMDRDDCPVPPQTDEAVWVDESLPDGAKMTRW